MRAIVQGAQRWRIALAAAFDYPGFDLSPVSFDRGAVLDLVRSLDQPEFAVGFLLFVCLALSEGIALGSR